MFPETLHGAWKLSMPNCIHLVCRPDKTGTLTNLKSVRHPIYRSETWELSRADAEALVGGWLYLHPTKASPSQFGGRVISVEESGHRTARGKPEYAFLVEARLEGKGRKWRGLSHAMAWTGGVVAGSHPHETAGQLSACSAIKPLNETT